MIDHRRFHWYGIPFTDCDCVHWLAYLDAFDIGSPTPKLTLQSATREGTTTTDDADITR